MLKSIYEQLLYGSFWDHKYYYYWLRPLLKKPFETKVYCLFRDFFDGVLGNLDILSDWERWFLKWIVNDSASDLFSL